MVRRYGRARRGRRAHGRAPCNTDPQITLIVGLNLGGFVEPMAFEGAMNGAIFEAYIRDRIAPRVQPGDVIVVDGLGAHRALGARAAVEERGAKFWILPPYSPDLSPVEACGSKVKEFIRSAAPRSVPQVYQAMGRAIGRVTERDAKGWFQHAGYIRPPRRPHPSRAGRTRKMAPPGERSRAPPAECTPGRGDTQ
jgi:transposase